MNDRKFSLRLVHGGATGNAEPDTPPQVATVSAAQAESVPDATPVDPIAARIAAAFEKAAGPVEPDDNFVVPATLLTQAEADHARKLILEYVHEGKSLRERLALAETAITPDVDGNVPTVDHFWETLQLCNRMGIVLSTGGHSFGMTKMTYATVLENKNLVRYIPELKKLSKKLPGLPLY
ncbi:hypothetical protein [Paraburkholderia sp. J12]|uniref:hypothetical protein n=1 Tax=Paraburkholderia sp. J12 TaxID=2805432 RepID=UPI002ABD35C8|nr:hypothetical protein [Paraburkholderia sp. J12]